MNKNYYFCREMENFYQRYNQKIQVLDRVPFDRYTHLWSFGTTKNLNTAFCKQILINVFISEDDIIFENVIIYCIHLI